ncbi:uncharacterized protein [Onthophagus taurus]|uniref:uncharacterized protein n=1 Tax=Onthophagus taurus TaxID=166361 RepID=UPI0039BECA12
MDEERKRRALLRSAFTRSSREVDTVLAANNPDLDDLEAVFNLLVEKMGDLKQTKILMNKVLSNAVSTASTSAPILANQSLSHKFKLPKIELKKFDGDEREWLAFWRQFKKVHEDEDLAPEDKFQYLISVMIPNSRAKDLIDCFPPTADNYVKAIETLEARFGRKDMLVEVYVRKLLKLVLNNAMDRGGICQMANVEGEERIALTVEGFGVETKGKSAKIKNVEPTQATAAGLINNGLASKCVFCEGNHVTDKCFNAQKMDLNEKKKILNNKRAFSMHTIGTFDLEADKSASQLQKKTEDVNLSNCTNMHVFLQTFVVKITGSGGEKKVRAIIDTGSQRSYVLKSVVTEIKCRTKRTERIVHALFGGTETEEQEHQCYEIRLLGTGISDPEENRSKVELEKAVKTLFKETTVVNEEGRYEVQLPWKEGHPPLPNNYNLAKKRLQSVYNKLQATGDVERYSDVFAQWLSEGIIERIPQDEIDNTARYLPHRPVFKESSTTTKVRPVFDASTKEKRTPSLNDCLEKGINLIELIPGVLLRFRIERVGVTSHIRKAFLQIRLNVRDREFLRFIWKTDEGKNLLYLH